MAPEKVKLEYIENETSRKVTYKKRVKCIVNKTKEISVLCGVDACCIVYGPNDHAPMVWPSSEPEAKRIISKFMEESEVNPSTTIFDQSTLLRESIIKANEKLMRIKKKNREMEMENVVNDILSGKPIDQISGEDLGDIRLVLENKLRSIEQRIGVVSEKNNAPNDGEDKINSGEHNNATRDISPCDIQVGPSNTHSP